MPGPREVPMDDLKYEMEEEARTGTRIKVIGVGDRKSVV